ncbi:MAG: fatty acid desaturase [candidate division Zixibacteria bacterium]|nr:fatty acid desaturase [candidate division Zixibacteria bacterium]
MTDSNPESHGVNGRLIQQSLSRFQQPTRLKSVWQLVNTLVPYAALWIAAYKLGQISFWLMLPVTVVAAGFMIRTFIIFHDCGHGSFFRSKKANDFWGVVTGIITFTPYHYWRASHARHHATSANLDQRGHGDVWMMTVAEYLAAPPFKRLQYRLYRNPIVMFLLGPLFILLVTHRFVRRKASKTQKLSVYGTNLGIIAIGVALSLVMGVWQYLLIQFMILFLGIMAGIWLFYVQHQFEDVYWAREEEWDFVTASLDGGSYYKLPAVLRWFTGSIGYHHIHHLNSRIPNYNLPHCQREIENLKQPTKSIGLWKSLKALGYRLWDEESRTLVGFRGVNRRLRQPSAP